MTAVRDSYSEQRGMTLIELMVVVAIVGIIVTAAVAAIGSDPTPVDTANRLANLMSETSRKAVAGGPVRADVAPTIPARAQLRLFYDADGNQTAVIERLEEQPTPGVANWVEIARSYLPTGVVVDGHTATPKVEESGLTPEESFAVGTEILVRCRPNGVCDGVTLYLRPAGGAIPAVRVVNLPLSGPLVLDSW